MAINDPINAGTATVTLRPVSAGRAIDLGNDTTGTLGLTQAELNLITAGVLQIGDTTTFTGNIDVTANISAPATWSTLRLFSSTGTVTQSGGSLTVANLVPNAGGGVTLNNAGNAVGISGAARIGTNNAFSFTNSTNLTIGGPAPGNTQGLKTGGGSVTISAGGSGSLTVLGNVGIDTTNGTGPRRAAALP